jgi:hypothetical protein
MGDGHLRSEHRVYTPDGARLVLNSILVDPDRLIFSADSLGVYEFPRPDKENISTTSAPKQF